jgi:membrane-bound metal-dependent hydrolase YbcI (DUF457 family)
VILWHVGGTILAFRYVFRDPNIDLRFLAIGSILPDLIDKPVGTIFWAGTFQSGRIYAHTLLFSFLLMGVVLALTKRGVWRRRWIALAVGSLFHLLLDGMWTNQEAFLWPAFGWSFPPGPEEYWTGFLDRLLYDPWMIVQEVVGLTYLVFLWRKAGLGAAERRRELWATGIIQA